MRALRIAAGCALVVVGVAGSATTIARASEGPSAFFATANGDGVRAVMEIKDYAAVEKVMDAGMPATQATIDSLGTSAAYAAQPYPGDLVLTAPGTGAIATAMICAPLQLPTCPAIPDYPLIAQSSFPGQDKGSLDQGTTKLRAQSTDSSSSSTAEGGLGDPASAGGGRSLAASDVRHDIATGAIAASAENTVESLTFTDVLRIGRAHSFAKVTQHVGGELTREAALEVSGMTIAGQSVSLTDKGLVLPGTATPLPNSSPLLGILAERGITIRYLAAETTPTGVVAPGAAISFPVTVPTAPKPATATFFLGRASAFGSAGGIGVAVGGGESSLETPIDGDGGTSVASPALDSGSGDGQPVASKAPTARQSGSARPTTALVRLGGASGLVAADWSVGFYLVLVIAGLVTLGSAQLFRIMGVRVAWTE